MRTTFLFSLISLAMPFVALADGHVNQYARRHNALANRMSGEVQLHKRFDNCRFTFYAVGLGACGQTNQPSDFIVALNTPQYGSGSPGPQCFKMITITVGSKTTTAQIMDECPGCPYGGLDMSTGLFQFFASESVGVLTGSWVFNDDSDSAPSSSSSPKASPTPTPTPTSTWTPPSSTWTPPSTTSTKEDPTTSSTKTSTSTKESSTSESSSTSWSSSSKFSTSVTPTTTIISTSSINLSSGAASGLAETTGSAVPTSSGSPANLNGLNLDIIDIGALIAAAAEAVNP